MLRLVGICLRLKVVRKLCYLPIEHRPRLTGEQNMPSEYG